MIDAKSRIERVRGLKEYLNLHEDSEYNFNEIYRRLLSEYNDEANYNSDFSSNLYLNNLPQTRDKQAAHYIEIQRKRTKGNCYSEFMLLQVVSRRCLLAPSTRAS